MNRHLLLNEFNCNDLRFNKKDIFYITLATLITTIPFVFQELHNDDFLWILTSAELIKHPLTPFYGNLTIAGHTLINLFTQTTHPPFYFYFLGLVIFLSGGINIVMLHISSILFALIATYSMYLLSKRFTTLQLPATMLLIASPAVMVMSHNFHCDIPNLSLFLLSLTTFIYASDLKSRKLFYISGVAALLAILTAYQSLLIFAIFPVYTLLKKYDFKMAIPAFLIPLGGLLIWIFQNIIVHGEPHITAILKQGNEFTISKLALHFMMMMSVLGGALMLPPALAFCWLKNRRYFFIYLICITVGLLFIMGNPIKGFTSKPLAGYNSFHTILFILFFSTGLFSFISIFIETLSTLKKKEYNSDTLFLAYWFTIFFISVSVFLPFVSVRYILPLLPCVVILSCRSINQITANFSSTFKSIFILIVITITFVTGFGVSMADYELAEMYKGIAEKVGITDKDHTWASGITDFFFNMDKGGIRILKKNDERVLPGDIVIQSKNLIPDDSYIQNLKGRLQLQNKISFDAAIPIRTMDFESHTGFYTYVWGFLPYSFSFKPLDEIYIYKVK